MPRNVTEAEVEELEALEELTRLRGWKIFRNLLNQHRIYCISNVHKHLEKQEDRMAGEWLARSKEAQKILSLIQTRKKELSEMREEVI